MIASLAFGVTGLAVLVRGQVSTQPLPPPSAAKESALAEPAVGNGCCLVRVHKKAVGQRTVHLGPPYRCPVGTTTLAHSQGPMTYRLTLSSEGTCDEPNPIPDKSSLVVDLTAGVMTHRADGFAYFTGTFKINNPSGSVLLQGTMELMDLLGTHHGPLFSDCEKCDQPRHLEGWLTGKGPNLEFRALFVAQVVTGNNPTGAVSGSIDGTIIRCP